MGARIRHLIPDDPACGSPFYTVDFVLLPDATASDDTVPAFESALLIEINPPPPVAGTVLFSWDDARDRAVITGRSGNGENYPCLRLVEKSVPWTKVQLHPP